MIMLLSSDGDLILRLTAQALRQRPFGALSSILSLAPQAWRLYRAIPKVPFLSNIARLFFQWP